MVASDENSLKGQVGHQPHPSTPKKPTKNISTVWGLKFLIPKHWPGFLGVHCPPLLLDDFPYK